MVYIQVIYDKFMKYVKELVHMGRFLSYHLCESSWLALTHGQVSQLLFMWIVLIGIDTWAGFSVIIYVNRLVWHWHMGRFLSYYLCESSWLALPHGQVSQLSFMWIVLIDIDTCAGFSVIIYVNRLVWHWRYWDCSLRILLTSSEGRIE